MICKRSRLVLALLAGLLGLPALAGGHEEPLARAAEAIERGDGVSAEIAAREALAQGAPPTAVDAYLGEAALLQGDLDGARQWLSSGRFDAPSAQRGYYALGRLELQQEHFGPAAQAFDRALAAGGPDARLWADIGRLRYKSGEQHLAADAVNRALAIDPAEPEALRFQAELVRDAQGLEAALPWFERAVQIAPQDVGLLGQYAATLGDLGRYADMLKVARAMTKLDGTDPQAYFFQAVLAARAGEDDLARRLLWKTGGKYDDAPAGLLLQGVLEYRDGSSELAVDKFARLLDMQPDNELAARLLGRALLADGDASEVVARFGARASRPDASPYLLTLVGRAYEAMDRRDLAAPFLDRAAQAADPPLGPLAPSEAGQLAIYRFGGDDPTAPAVAVPTLRKLLSERRGAEAEAFTVKLRRRFPHSSDIEVLTGDTALLAGNPAHALSLYRTAAGVRWTAALAERIAAAQTRLGREDLAAAELTTFLLQHPHDRGIAALLGRAAAAGGDWSRAQVLLEHAVQLAGGDGDPRLLADLADVQLRLGDGANALANAERAYVLQRSSARTTQVLSAALEQPKGAEVLLAKARALGKEAVLALR
jgi:tetratricopeptide (TPR) repeat protein